MKIYFQLQVGGQPRFLKQDLSCARAHNRDCLCMLLSAYVMPSSLGPLQGCCRTPQSPAAGQWPWALQTWRCAGRAPAKHNTKCKDEMTDRDRRKTKAQEWAAMVIGDVSEKLKAIKDVCMCSELPSQCSHAWPCMHACKLRKVAASQRTLLNTSARPRRKCAGPS